MSRPCDATIADGRLRKAKEFLQAAADVGELADDEAEVRDAVVTLLVHAGIAAKTRRSDCSSGSASPTGRIWRSASLSS